MIFACLLRLYPASFRQRYRDEALQLLNDRLREERGLLPRLRLWLELLADLAWGLPQAYRNTYSPTATLSPAEKAGQIPLFQMLEQNPLRPGTLLMGSMGTLAILGLLVFVMNHAGPYPPEEKGSLSSIERVMQRLNQPLIPESIRANVSASLPSSSGRPEVSPHALNAPRFPQAASEAATLSPPPAIRAARLALAMHPAAKDQSVRSPSRPAPSPIPIAVPAGEHAANPQAIGASGPVRRMATQVGNSTPSAPLASGYSPTPGSSYQLRLAAAPPIENPVSTVPQNRMVEELKTLPGNIGYVKISKFADPATSRATAQQLMDRLNQTDAIIFDLRGCTGGNPEMVRLMASRLADKPVFVLTSSQTFLGAEHVAYNLKLLNRATIVGEATSGISNAGEGTTPRRIADSNPRRVWKGTGVKPDVQVKAAEALDTAEKLALAAVHRN